MYRKKAKSNRKAAFKILKPGFSRGNGFPKMLEYQKPEAS